MQAGLFGDVPYARSIGRGAQYVEYAGPALAPPAEEPAGSCNVCLSTPAFCPGTSYKRGKPSASEQRVPTHPG